MQRHSAWPAGERTRSQIAERGPKELLLTIQCICNPRRAHGGFNPAAEPGLILTPPDKATSGRWLSVGLGDRCSTDADWVVLSACNTAAGGAQGAEALWLARAFFYAGARALLVLALGGLLDAGRSLITMTLSTMAADRRLGVAREALRRSMLVLMRRRTQSTCTYWAPFVVVGEGAASR